MKTLISAFIFLSALTAVIFLLPTPDTKPGSQSSTEGNKTSEPSSEYTSERNSFHLIDVTVFDGVQWHENGELIVQNGQVVNTKTAKSQLPVIDGKHMYVIPGLIDAHTHTWGSALEEALLFGVTTELDMFTQVAYAQQARESRDLNDKTSQADFYSAGTLVTSTGGHGTEYGFAIPTIDRPEDAEQFVIDRLEEGSDYIKVVYHHGSDYYGLTSISREVLQAVIHQAHAHQKLAVVHISNHQSAVEAVAAGADGLVHTFGDQIISNELLSAMKSQGVFIIPTLSVIASMAQSSHSLELAADENLSQHLSISSKNGMKPFANMTPRPETLSNAIENTRIMHQYGIVVLAGSDAPNPGTAHGISMHGELDLLSQAGLTPTEALQSAGWQTSQQFAIGNRGTLMTGSKADFLLLSADPRKDIKNTRKIISVWKNGYVIEAQEDVETSDLEIPKSGLISDFSQKSLSTAFDTSFQFTSDQMMQGNSTASIKWDGESCDGGGLKVNGEIKAGFPYPWAGVFLPFSEKMDQILPLKNFKSLDFLIAGDPGTYQLMVFTLNNMQPVQLPFEVTKTCQNESIILSEHQNVDWELVTGFAWVADGSRLNAGLATFTFKLDNIKFNQ